MTKRFNNSLSNSLKGKIWLATTALAFFICIFGIISYLIASFLINDTFYAVAIPFLVLAATVAVFGWWLVNEIVNPVEKVILISKSLERGLSTSLPKTSGATETDELMETIFRVSQQSQKLVNLMDEVAQGKFDVIVSPHTTSDRISNTFQKLLTKVSESIHAKQELEKLQKSLKDLTENIAPLREDKLNVALDEDESATGEISETISHLQNELNDIISQVKVNAGKTQTSSVETRRKIDEAIDQDEKQIKKLTQASVKLKQVPQMVQQITEELSQSVFSANQSIEKAQKGNTAAQSNLDAATLLRQQIYESIKHIHKLNESSQELEKVSKTIEDLAQRTGMIALNSSISAAETTGQSKGFSIISEEIDQISRRANNTHKTVSTLNKSIQSEINSIEISLEQTVREVANLSKFAIETGNSIGELERYIAQFLNLQEKIVSHTRTKTEETENAFQVVAETISAAEKTIADLKESSQATRKITDNMNKLSDSVAHFEYLSLAESEETPKPGDQSVQNVSFASLYEVEEQGIS